MEQRQFEQAVEHMVRVEGHMRLRPDDVAYRLNMSVKDAERLLDRMVTDGGLELDSDDAGNLFYFIPGIGTGGVFSGGSSFGPDPSAAASDRGWPGRESGGARSPWTKDDRSGHRPGPGGGFAGHGPSYPYQGHGAPPPTYGGAPQGYGQPHMPAPYPPPSHQPYPPPHHSPYHGASNDRVNYAPGYSAPPPHHGPPNYNHGPAGYPPAMSTTTYPPPHQAHGYGTGSSYPQPYGYGQHALVPTGHMVEPKSPAAASLLSAFFPGAGQLYNNEVGKGLFFFFSTLFLLVLPPLFLFPWLWGVFDAYATSRRINIQNSAPMGYLPP